MIKRDNKNGTTNHHLGSEGAVARPVLGSTPRVGGRFAEWLRVGGHVWNGRGRERRLEASRSRAVVVITRVRQWQDYAKRLFCLYMVYFEKLCLLYFRYILILNKRIYLITQHAQRVCEHGEVVRNLQDQLFQLFAVQVIQCTQSSFFRCWNAAPSQFSVSHHGHITPSVGCFANEKPLKIILSMDILVCGHVYHMYSIFQMKWSSVFSVQYG